jgi:hypothetical protein
MKNLMIIVLIVLGNSISRCHADEKRVKKGNRIFEMITTAFLRTSLFFPPIINEEFVDATCPVKEHHSSHPLEDEEPDDEEIEYSLARNQTRSEEEDDEDDEDEER